MVPSVQRDISPEEHNLLVTKTIDLLKGSVEVKRAEILEYFHKTFSLYESLFQVIKDDASYFYQPEPLRHPLIFYYGHTAVFFINKLVLSKMVAPDQRISPKLESTCAVGVDEMSWDDLNSKHYDWPKVSEVTQYRNDVRALMDRFIRETQFTMPISWDSPMWPVLMGIEHERIHLETSSVLIRQMKIQDVQTQPAWTPCSSRGQAPQNELVDILPGVVHLGKSYDDSVFGWDNEYGTRTVEVAPFRASKFLVSNGEFFEFVKANAYNKREYWSDEGWRWATYRQAQHPVFWVKRGDSYLYRTMTEEIEMPWNWPVDINYLEAKAFCNWMSETTGMAVRMPMEEEYARLRDLMTVKCNQHMWDRAPGNINLEYFASSCPVDMFKQSISPELYDIAGNVWQWNETPMHPLDGFKVHPLYDDFTTPTFDTRHNLILGGSWVSTGNEATTKARYAFRRHFFQHAGLRYIVSDAPVVMPPNAEPYETDRTVCEQIHSQFGNVTSRFVPVNFYEAAAALCTQHRPADVSAPKGAHRMGKVLEIGCLGGRTSFELARHFDEVVGVEASARLIQVGHRLQEGGTFHYTTPDQGELLTYHALTLADLDCDPGDVKRVTLIQNDPVNLSDRLRDFDVVLVTNLTRVVDPVLMLSKVHERMRPQGTLVVCSAYDWDAERTPVEKWIGGRKVDAESLSSFDHMSQILGGNFEFQTREDLPLLIQEEARKYRILDIECTIWKRM